MATSRRSLLALVVLVAAIGLSSSQSLTSTQKASIDRTVRQLMRCANIPALSLSYVSLEPGIIYNQGYGTSNPRMQKAVGQRSVFCLGGATQAFTAVLLAKLIDENQKEFKRFAEANLLQANLGTGSESYAQSRFHAGECGPASQTNQWRPML